MTLTTEVTQTSNVEDSNSDNEKVPPHIENTGGTKGTEAAIEAHTVESNATTAESTVPTSEPKRINPDSRVFLRVVVGGVFVAGLVAFAISFVALYSVAEWFRLPPWMWWAVPVFIDLAILVYAGLVLVHKARGEQTWPSWVALGAFNLLSVVANGAHALAHSHETPWQAYVGVLIAAMVPIAIFVATEQLSRVAIQDLNSRKSEMRDQLELEAFAAEQQQRHDDLAFEREQRGWERENQRAKAQREVELEQREHELMLAKLQHQPSNGTDAAQKVTEQPQPIASRTDRVAQQSGNDDQLIAFVQDNVAQGIEITGALVAEDLNVSDRTGRRRIKELQQNRPELFEPVESNAETHAGKAVVVDDE